MLVAWQTTHSVIASDNQHTPTVVPLGHLAWTLYIDPTVLPRQIRKGLARARAKRYAQHIDQVSFQLPSVDRVK